MSGPSGTEKVLAEWFFDQAGAPCLILDESRIRNGRGVVVGWVNGSNVYLRHGQHVGWFEGGVIYDSTNCALAYSRNRTGYLPSGTAVRGGTALPALPEAPPSPQFAVPPGKPGRGAWSRHDPGNYFAA